MKIRLRMLKILKDLLQNVEGIFQILYCFFSEDKEMKIIKDGFHDMVHD